MKMTVKNQFGDFVTLEVKEVHFFREPRLASYLDGQQISVAKNLEDLHHLSQERVSKLGLSD